MAGKAGKVWSLPRISVPIRSSNNNWSKNFGVEYWTLPGSNSIFWLLLESTYCFLDASLCDIINGPYCTCHTFTVVVMQSSCSHQAFVRNPLDILFKSVRLRIAFYTESLCAIFIQSINNNVLKITSKSCTSINWLEIGS